MPITQRLCIPEQELRVQFTRAKINDVYQRVRHGQAAGRAVITP